MTPDYGRQFLNKLIIPGLKDLGAMIVAPNCPAPSDTWTSQVAEISVKEVIDYMFTEYNIDQSKVLVVGYSMGGIGIWPHVIPIFSNWPFPLPECHIYQLSIT